MALRAEQRYPTDLTQEEWALVEPLIPPKTGPGRNRTLDLRQVVNALLYREETGCRWRMLPGDFPPWQSVRYYFDKWMRDGTWERIVQALGRQARTDPK